MMAVPKDPYGHRTSDHTQHLPGAMLNDTLSTAFSTPSPRRKLDMQILTSRTETTSAAFPAKDGGKARGNEGTMAASASGSVAAVRSGSVRSAPRPSAQAHHWWLQPGTGFSVVDHQRETCDSALRRCAASQYRTHFSALESEPAAIRQVKAWRPAASIVKRCTLASTQARTNVVETPSTAEC